LRLPDQFGRGGHAEDNPANHSPHIAQAYAGFGAEGPRMSDIGKVVENVMEEAEAAAAEAAELEVVYDANGMPPFIMLRVTLDELNLILEQRKAKPS
jgi:hypothetical protein